MGVPEAIGGRRKKKELSDEQKGVVIHVLESTDAVIGVRGVAGSGKTATMTETVEAIRVMTGRNVVTVAPTGKASRGELRGVGFDKADTLMRLLVDEKMQKQARGGVIYVDEAGLVGSQTMNALLKLADKLGARVVLQGDTRQHQSVDRGDSMRLLEQRGGLKCAELSTIRRQRREEYREVVELLAEGDALGAFDKLVEIGAVVELDGEERYDRMAADYLGKLEAGPLNIKRSDFGALIATTHREGEKATAIIREGMMARGLLGEERELAVLASTDWTEAQREDANAYRAGQVVEFLKPAQGWQKSERAYVKEVTDENRANGTVTVVRASKGKRPHTELEEVTLDVKQLADRFQVYGLEKLTVAVGDVVRVTKGGTDGKGARLETGDTYEVRGFDDKTGHLLLGTEEGNIVRKKDGTESLKPGKVSRALDMMGALHLANGYYSTSQAIQGPSVEHAFVSQPAESFGAANLEQVMVSWSRMRETMTLYTDDIAGLRNRIQQSSHRAFAVDVVPRDERTEAKAEVPKQNGATTHPAMPAGALEGRRREAAAKAEAQPKAKPEPSHVSIYDRIREEWREFKAYVKSKTLNAWNAAERRQKEMAATPAKQGAPSYVQREAQRSAQREREGPER